MKTFLDFLPLLLFAGTYKFFPETGVLFGQAYQLKPVFAATGVLMLATLFQMAMIYRMDGKLTTMHKVTLIFVLLFGGLTLVLHDERFIQWKPTLLYSCMALALVMAHSIFRKNVLEIMLGSQLVLPQAIWNKLNLAWVAYTLFMAALNAYVVLFYSFDFWVNFKLWGYAFPLVFIVAQGLYLAPHLQNDTRTKDAAP
jgi:intracellular septation protein